MRARHLVAAGLAAVSLAGCASASDVASTHSNGAVQQDGGSKTTTPAKPSPSSPASTSSAPTTASPSPPKTSSPTQPPKRRHLPHVVGAVRVFRTPSHNIGCMLAAGQARCDIRKHVYRDPQKPPNCRGDYGQSLAVTKHGVASFICVTDTVFDNGAPVLAYGTSSVVGDFGCTSRTTGIRCYHLKSRHGFWLSQHSPALF